MASAAKKRHSVIIAMDGSDASLNAFNCEYNKIQYLSIMSIDQSVLVTGH